MLEERKIEEAVRAIPEGSFTILDFVEVFKEEFPEDWERLIQRFGDFGEKRRYTIKTYLSNRLDVYSQKPASVLRPLVHWSDASFADRRRTTREERKVFGSPWIAVYRKKGEKQHDRRP